MTRQSDSKEHLVAEIETELTRAARLGLLADPSMRNGVRENLHLLASHHEIVASALAQKDDAA